MSCSPSNTFILEIFICSISCASIFSMNLLSVRLLKPFLFLSIIKYVPQVSCGNASANFSINSPLSLLMLTLLMFTNKLHKKQTIGNIPVISKSWGL
ncbi:hypothetical protein HanPI659440_Chr11g0412881 [Helianthus annuus]|nr:hypothetical protein HanPI659440_Chr11g0412881 [Helianthus annuus]